VRKSMRKQGGGARAERARISVERLPEWQIVNDLVAASLSRHTRQIYGSSQHKFEAWCSERRLKPMPAEGQTVAMPPRSGPVSGRQPSFDISPRSVMLISTVTRPTRPRSRWCGRLSGALGACSGPRAGTEAGAYGRAAPSDGASPPEDQIGRASCRERV